MLNTASKPASQRNTVHDAKSIVEHRELSWLTEHVERGRRQKFAIFCTITPAIARHLLDHNDDNRPVRSARVDEIAADIIAKRYDCNGEPIIVAKDGKPNDGQHRLMAVIQANASIETLVVFGVDRDSRFTVDMGVARTTGDFLGMEGAKHKNEAAAAAKLFLMHRKGIFHSSRDNAHLMTKAAIRSEYWNNQKAFDEAIEQVGTSKFTKMVGKTGLIAAYVILKSQNRAQAAYFFSKLANPTGLNDGDAILSLRDRLMNAGQLRLKPPEKLEMILRHWNAWRRNATMSRYYPQKAFPKIER